jgi:hypothetical protein
LKSRINGSFRKLFRTFTEGYVSSARRIREDHLHALSRSDRAARADDAGRVTFDAALWRLERAPPLVREYLESHPDQHGTPFLPPTLN